MPTDPAPQARTLQILFVCYGNSCRSQMAEALANQLSTGKVRAYSAGSHPLGTILPTTYEVMKENGMSLEGQWSKGLGDVPVAEMDVVVTMGCEVSCPVPTGFRGRVVEWNIPDPYGHDAGRYRAVRDLIARQVGALLADLAEQSQELPPASPSH